MKIIAQLLLSLGLCSADIDDQRLAETKAYNRRVYDQIIDRLLTPYTPPSPDDVLALRNFGPDAFDRLLEVIDARYPSPKPTEPKLINIWPPRPTWLNFVEKQLPEEFSPQMKTLGDQEQINHLHQIIDQVAGQKYASVSRLFWFDRDMDAKEYASRVHRPIISLRLLGKLTDEYSCANSRFFRTLLYPDPSIQQLMKERAVLSWESVRPVPRITIDFGDGRRIEQTITGNSIHYIMDEHGRLVDAIPGLYSPTEFARALKTSLDLAEQVAALPQEAFEERIRSFHAGRVAETKQRFKEALASIRDRSKIADWILSADMMDDLNQVEALLPENTWELLAEKSDVHFAAPTHRFIRGMRPTFIMLGPKPAIRANRLAVNKNVGENAMLRILASLGQTVAADTWQNELVIRRKISQKLMNVPAAHSLPNFNAWVYADIFLTPSSDPWLGLIDADTFTALPEGGAVVHLPTTTSATSTAQVPPPAGTD
jgi:hypothetical protein